MGTIRSFPSGATRDQDADKLDFEGFLSPLVLQMFAEYMHKHRVQSDGTLRASDNWQKGIPLEAYAKSLHRHFHSFWLHHRGHPQLANEDAVSALMGMLFNVQGYAHELLKQHVVLAPAQPPPTEEI